MVGIWRTFGCWRKYGWIRSDDWLDCVRVVGSGGRCRVGEDEYGEQVMTGFSILVGYLVGDYFL